MTSLKPNPGVAQVAPGPGRRRGIVAQAAKPVEPQPAPKPEELKKPKAKKKAD